MMRVGLTAVVCAMVFASGCTLADQSAPPLAGPSGLGLDLTITASPESLARDGSSTSVISIHANYPDRPFKGRLLLSATAGTVSAPEVSTTDGNAAFVYTAPGLNENVSTVTVAVTPVENGDLGNSRSRTVRIAVMGPDVPVASFTFSPSAPSTGTAVLFDASGTRLNGAECGTTCTYTWDFGDGSSGTGQLIQHTFQTAGVGTVTLTVAAPGGTSHTATRSFAIAAPAPPDAAFTVTPTSPKVNAQAIFNATSSTVGTGATLVQYLWDFGDGTTATTTVPVTTKTYTVVGTYVVTLTVTDSLGRTDTAQPVAVVVVP